MICIYWYSIVYIFIKAIRFFKFFTIQNKVFTYIVDYKKTNFNFKFKKNIEL